MSILTLYLMSSTVWISGACSPPICIPAWSGQRVKKCKNILEFLIIWGDMYMKIALGSDSTRHYSQQTASSSNHYWILILLGIPELSFNIHFIIHSTLVQDLHYHVIKYPRTASASNGHHNRQYHSNVWSLEWQFPNHCGHHSTDMLRTKVIGKWIKSMFVLLYTYIYIYMVQATDEIASGGMK